jgi:hypothetical protein
MFGCFAKMLEWKQMCKADTYIRPWYKKVVEDVD